MAKNIFKQSAVPEQQKFQQSVPKNKYFQVRFNQNRSFEIHVAGQMIKFPAYGLPTYPAEYAKKGIPESIINHPEFQSVRKYFSII